MKTTYYKVVAVEDPSANNPRTWEKKYDTLQEALTSYETFTDWGFADTTKVVAIMDADGNRLVSKEFHRPAGSRPISYS